MKLLHVFFAGIFVILQSFTLYIRGDVSNGGFINKPTNYFGTPHTELMKNY